jgi:ABC-type uncharacterized transport system permease subunit
VSAPTSPAVSDTVQGEPPTSSARLTISMGPAQVGGTAEGNVPSEQARYLITTFGILGCAVTGCSAAVAALRLAPAQSAPGLALALLGFAFATATLIALCGRPQARRKNNRRKIPQGQPRPPSS